MSYLLQESLQVIQLIPKKEYYLLDVSTQYKNAAFFLMQPSYFEHFDSEYLESIKRTAQYPGLKLVDCHGVKIPEMTFDILSHVFGYIEEIQSVTGQYPDLVKDIDLCTQELSILPEIKGKPKTDDGLEVKLRRIDLIALKNIFTDIHSFLKGELDNEVGYDELMVILVMRAIDYYQEKTSVFENYHNKIFEIPFKFLQPYGGPKKFSPCICENCNRLFIRYSQASKFCPKCRPIIKQELQRQRRLKLKNQRPQKYCKNCSKPLPKGNLKREYCNNKGKCRVAYHRKKCLSKMISLDAAEFTA